MLHRQSDLAERLDQQVQKQVQLQKRVEPLVQQVLEVQLELLVLGERPVLEAQQGLWEPKQPAVVLREAE